MPNTSNHPTRSYTLSASAQDEDVSSIRFHDWKGRGMSDQATVTTTVLGCARCGQNHEGLTFKRFAQPIVDPDGTIWDYWTLCPVSDDPILLRKIEANAEDFNS